MEGVGVRLLIVEDDPDIRESLGELLGAEGFEVSLADNGKSALDHLGACENLPQVILLDLMMPVMSGEQFRFAQLADARWATIPIVIMSAAQELDQTGERLKAAAVLKKPLGIDPLIDTLRKAAVAS
ncbi:MAG TPA: response regulator [Kofleriaceae bacterium]|nr:response regulator [Kofleriaceae bacterium]